MVCVSGIINSICQSLNYLISYSNHYVLTINHWKYIQHKDLIFWIEYFSISCFSTYNHIQDK